jgi:prophage DNA circulation protein
MTWREQIYTPSFRKVPFRVRSADGELGRRSLVKEYPGRDIPSTQDMGRKARAYTLEIFVSGADYMAARDNLIKALNGKGPGTLVHPYLGPLSVVVRDVRGPKESTKDGGMASFSVTFAESDRKIKRTTKVDTQAAVEAAANEAGKGAADDFEKNTNDAPYPEFILTSLIKDAKAAYNKAMDAKDKLMEIADNAAEFVESAEAFANEISSLIRAPGQFATRMMGLVGKLKSLPGKIDSAFGSYKELFDIFGSDLDEIPRSGLLTAGATGGTPVVLPNGMKVTLAPGSTPSRAMQKLNQVAMAELNQKTALIEYARVSSQVTYASQDDAMAVIETLVDRMDQVAEMQSTSDTTYQLFMKLKTACVRDIKERGEKASSLGRYTPALTLPSLVVAHNIFGDASKEGALVARNPHVLHPGFVPGGRTLEVEYA